MTKRGKRPCPHCGANNDDGHTSMMKAPGKQRAPRPGDLSVCAHCGVGLVVNDEGQFRLLDVSEWLALDWETKRTLGRATAVANIGRLLASGAITQAEAEALAVASARAHAGLAPFPCRIDPGEWIEIGHVAVRTRSILAASSIAAQVKRTRQAGVIDGVEFMDLGMFREVLEGQGGLN